MDFNSSLLQEALLKIQNQRDQPQVINSTIKNLLHSNNLAIRPIPEGGSNLMRAVSDCLYFTTNKYQEIQALCFKYFQKLFQQKKLTRTLEKFYHNFQLLSDYCNNPELSIFDDVNLEVVSMIYKVKVIVFSVGDDSYLNSKQFNSKNHTKIIQLLWDDGIYTPVYDEQFLDHAKMAQNFIYEVLGKVIDAELVNPDHDFVHLEFQHQQDKENKRESRKSPYKFPAPTEGLSIKRSFSQQNLKELDQSKEKSNNKEFSAQVGYHNLKTANERIMTQSNKQQKHFTFNLNECNDDYEQPPAEDSKRQFFTEFLDPWTNLLLHQNEESQECAPISPVGYKQFMYIQMQQQQQMNAYNYSQYQVPQIPPIYHHYPNAAPSPLPNAYTTQPPAAFNYFASPYPHYEDFAQPPPQMQADYQHVSEAWYTNSQQQQMHHYPYQMIYQEQNQIRYIPQQQQQQGQQQQATNAQPPFAPINTNPIEPYKNRIVIPQPIEQQPQQQQTIIGNIYYHPPSQGINQGIPPSNISNISQQPYISTPPPTSLPPAIIHQTQPGSIDNVTVLVPPDRVVNNINQNIIGRKQPIQQNYSQQSDAQFSNFNTNINDVHNITSLLDSDNIYQPQQQIPNDNQQVFLRQSSQPQQQQNINFNMPYRQQNDSSQLSTQGSSDEAQKQKQFSQKNYGLNSNGNNNQNQNNKQTYNQQQSANVQNNPSNNYQQNNFKMSNQSKTSNDKIQKEAKNNNTYNNNKMNPHSLNISNSNNNNNQSFNTSYNNNPNNYNNSNINNINNSGSNNNNSNSIGSSKNLQKQKIPNSNSIDSSNNIDDQKDPQKMKEPKKPEVLEQTEEKKKGRLKFFDTSNNFGFFNMDEDQSDVFVHLDDLQVTTVPKDLLKHSSLMNLRFKFHFIKYIGKHKQSRKAVDIEYIPEESEETILPQFANAANSQNQETNSQSSKNTSSNTLNSFSSLSPDKKVRKIPNNQSNKPFQTQQSYQNNNNSNTNQIENVNQYQQSNFKGQPHVNNNNNNSNQNNYNSNTPYNHNNNNNNNYNINNNSNNNNNFNGNQYQKRNSYNQNNNINNSNPNSNYNFNNNNNPNINNFNNNNFINNNSYKHNSQKTYPQNNGISQRPQQF
ncbi:hypothetical protein ABPG72_022137 [Tetrahymena utriculariae]